MERQVLHDAGTTLQQQLVTLAGRGTVEVEVALVALPQHVLGDDAAQLHLRRVLTEKKRQLLAAHAEHTAVQHRLNRRLRRTPVEAVGIVAHELAHEREPRDVFPVVADAVCHVLEAPLGDEAEPPCGVALALHLLALAVNHALPLLLAELAQHLEVQTIIPEFLFHRQSVVTFGAKVRKVSETKMDN